MNVDDLIAVSSASVGLESRVFDWDKAAKIIRDSGAISASAGLDEDWWWTAGDIYTDGLPRLGDQSGPYLASTRATPVLEIGGERVACFRMASDVPEWDQSTNWPQSAIDILKGGAL